MNLLHELTVLRVHLPLTGHAFLHCWTLSSVQLESRLPTGKPKHVSAGTGEDQQSRLQVDPSWGTSRSAASAPDFSLSVLHLHTRQEALAPVKCTWCQGNEGVPAGSGDDQQGRLQADPGWSASRFAAL